MQWDGGVGGGGVKKLWGEGEGEDGLDDLGRMQWLHLLPCDREVRPRDRVASDCGRAPPFGRATASPPIAGRAPPLTMSHNITTIEMARKQLRQLEEKSVERRQKDVGPHPRRLGRGRRRLGRLLRPHIKPALRARVDAQGGDALERLAD